MAGMHARYGNAQGDNHALCESWIGQTVRAGTGAREYIPRIGHTGIWMHLPAEFDSCLVPSAVATLRGSLGDLTKQRGAGSIFIRWPVSSIQAGQSLEFSSRLEHYIESL